MLSCLFMISNKHFYHYALVGGATGHTVVGLCMYLSVCLSVGRISRRSQKTKRWKLQHKLKSIFAWKWIVRILVIRLCSWVIAWLLTSRSPAGDLVADVKTKLSTAGCLTASEFAFTSEQHGRSCVLELWRSFAYLAIYMAVAGDLEFSVDKNIHSWLPRSW